MANFSNEDYKLLIALRAIKAMYEMTGDYHLGICGRIAAVQSNMYERMNDEVIFKIEDMICKWPNGNGSSKYPIDVTGEDCHEQFKYMLTKKKDWKHYAAYAKKRMELLRYLINQMEVVCK